MKNLLILLIIPLFSIGQCIKGDCKNGYGTYTDNNGFKYVGEFKDGKKHGQGTGTWRGVKYVGEYKDDKMHGQGIYTASSGSKYVGEFKDNEYHGYGIYTISDGTKYVGDFKDGKQHGYGTLSDEKGRIIYAGEWRNDLPTN